MNYPILFAIACLAFLPDSLLAQEPYPTKPVTIVVPFSPGGGTDTGARWVAQKLAERWGQAVVVDNKPGAAGMIGADFVARAKPDGYTIAMFNAQTAAVNPAGNGSSTHLAAALFESQTGTKLVHVPYKGGGPAMQDLMGGVVNLTFLTVLESASALKSGRVRPTEMRERFIVQGATPVGSTPAEFKALIDSETQRYKKLIVEKNITATD